MVQYERKAMRGLAIYDFDGTITTRDSFFAFIIFSHSSWSVFKKSIFLIPVLVLFTLRLTTRHNAKEKVFTSFFRGYSTKSFSTIAQTFTETKLNDILRTGALQSIQGHRESGNQVMILSASPDMILTAFCTKHDIQLIATKVEHANGDVTGNFASPNCRGEEKVRRIESEINLEQFDYIYAYGDTPSDKAFMSLANEAFYKPFRN